MSFSKMVGTSTMMSPPRKAPTSTDGGNSRGIPLDFVDKTLFNSALFSFPRNSCNLLSVLNNGEDHHVGCSSSRSTLTTTSKNVRVCQYTEAMPQELAAANMVFLVE